MLVQVKGVEPLGNVLEYYGGNDSKMRSDWDSRMVEEDQQAELNFKTELPKLNRHFDGNYVVVNRAKTPNIDEDHE